MTNNSLLQPKVMADLKITGIESHTPPYQPIRYEEYSSLFLAGKSSG